MLASIVNDAGSKKLKIDKIKKLINDGISDNLMVSRSTNYRRIKWNNLLRFKKPQLRDQSISKKLSVIRSKFLLRHLLKLMLPTSPLYTWMKVALETGIMFVSSG